MDGTTVLLIVEYGMLIVVCLLFGVASNGSATLFSNPLSFPSILTWSAIVVPPLAAFALLGPSFSRRLTDAELTATVERDIHETREEMAREWTLRREESARRSTLKRLAVEAVRQANTRAHRIHGETLRRAVIDPTHPLSPNVLAHIGPYLGVSSRALVLIPPAAKSTSRKRKVVSKIEGPERTRSLP